MVLSKREVYDRAMLVNIPAAYGFAKRISFDKIFIFLIIVAALVFPKYIAAIPTSFCYRTEADGYLSCDVFLSEISFLYFSNDTIYSYNSEDFFEAARS